MKRLPKPLGDVSGQVNNDPQYVSDHIAIRNLLSAYGHVLDDDHYDTFMAMFSQDNPVLQISVPCWANFEIVGQKNILEFVHTRFKGRKVFLQGRHTMAMIHVASQTSATATARAQAVLSVTPNDGQSVAVVGRASYNFWLEKHDNAWKVAKLYIELDSPLTPHSLPETTFYEADNRSMCSVDKKDP
ncbi:MAG: nuclear transport factor 2 family protein [Lysobacterales bacterium]